VDDADQAEMSRKLIEKHGQHPTEQKDRNYFRSVYFREPGGILFEIATGRPPALRWTNPSNHSAST
jgi:glyoxalase family protein